MSRNMSRNINKYNINKCNVEEHTGIFYRITNKQQVWCKFCNKYGVSPVTGMLRNCNRYVT